MDKVRDAATKVVFEVSERGAYSNVALIKILREYNLRDIDRRFCTELVYGTVKAGDSIDWIISKYVSRPLKKIDPKVLAILRVGMYQIFFLDRVPNSAAVNESVELAKTISIGSSKFVNAVLRSAVREPDKAKFPLDNTAQSLALSTFHPLWLIERWIEQFGFEDTKKLCMADNVEPPISLRVNLLRTTRDKVIDELKKLGADVIPSKLVDEGVICKNLGSLDNLALLQQGLFQVQDESSMLAAHILNPEPNDVVIDCCAAPGGKATHIAELMNNQGKIIAADVHAHKIDKINENAKRLGINIIETILIDAREIGDKFADKADKVIVDVPCSGLGVLRRKADVRWKKNLKEIKMLPTLQMEILNSAAKAVKADGILVYSTCTLERAENEDIVEKFLTSHDDFILEEKKILLPHIDGTDGFFIAKMRKLKKIIENIK